MSILGSIFTPRPMPKLVYPLYLMSRARMGLRNSDSEQIIAEIGEIRTLLAGSAYALSVTDFNDTKYRITVEVVE